MNVCSQVKLHVFVWWSHSVLQDSGCALSFIILTNSINSPKEFIISLHKGYTYVQWYNHILPPAAAVAVPPFGGHWEGNIAGDVPALEKDYVCIHTERKYCKSNDTNVIILIRYEVIHHHVSSRTLQRRPQPHRSSWLLFCPWNNIQH